ncbi:MULTISPECIES: hypothetical protein [Pseudoalteromonas]|uniref:hypothetical protein n=1 Tax=Pseudoalteromonas TaxID=53246 RepID=UPI000580172E|nr:MULTISPECIES: hypothetical protein [Pseudoalteromonas]KID37134.1 hypothetical protein QT15_07435 [Pseudoalteromonas flavipulchra NCIMB 2033 = ATCC BAA-314]MBD0782941.1 hypothetical protein [Pseudoalteromonas flavipulchra]MBE0374814.1 hypothetical protein [Pseudoalteromonas flavipulchra NCIMB 2033 = ATCC BAA-314]MCG7540825.1 hypothetical protein [Pseudoalteromonas sp. OF7H-1]MCG9771467.1 hypothetical protein [Pseudoalteromonas piscicida]
MFDFIKGRKTPETPKNTDIEAVGAESEVTVKESQYTVGGKVVKERHVTVTKGDGGPAPATPTPPQAPAK